MLQCIAFAIKMRKVKKILRYVIVLLVVCVTIPLLGFFVYTKCFWQRWSPARIERITEVRVPRYKIVKYDKKLKGRKKVFWGDIDIRFKSIPDDRIFHKIDSIMAIGKSYWRKDGDTYIFSRIWAEGLPVPKGEMAKSQEYLYISITKGSFDAFIRHITW